MRVILDTNVFVSGIFWTGAPFRILEAWQGKKIKPIFSQEILNEYNRVAHILAQKYKQKNIIEIIELLLIYGEIATPSCLKEAVSRDPDDDKFIACALGADCPIIVSGDKDLLTISGYQEINILTPAEFVKNYLD